ncbi:S13-like H2TH domain-containing protein [Violaceomyces palustris]|uniref:S13-like H2TH domain-containing protein n=1 Tax=Violaceomyces palustris TaxID=1673888 RepID=A0ACD0NTE6_9BASI|nr:S13-like H2TH domain-containing protein [Violaceomyces palustris]
MFLLGVQLPDHKLLRIALTNFYGISYDTARRLCARLQLHERATVGSLNENQITQLSAYLSSPASIPARKPFPTSSVAPSTILTPSPVASSSSSSQSPLPSSSSSSSSSNQNPNVSLPPSQRPSPSSDPLRSIVIEADLRRQLHANLAHHRNVGSYVGRRHSAHLPVRGQRTNTNAQTAKKLNRLERKGLSTLAATRQAGETELGLDTSRRSGTSPLLDLMTPLARVRFGGF